MTLIKPQMVTLQQQQLVLVLMRKDCKIVFHPGSVFCFAVCRYPIFENPYPLTLHESPVTCCEYFADCPAELIPAFYSVGSRQKRQGYSKKVCSHNPQPSTPLWLGILLIILSLCCLVFTSSIIYRRVKTDRRNKLTGR